MHVKHDDNVKLVCDNCPQLQSQVVVFIDETDEMWLCLNCLRAAVKLLEENQETKAERMAWVQPGEEFYPTE